MTENRWRERDKVTLTAGEGGMEGGELVLREETHPPRRGGSNVSSRYAVRRAQQHTAFPFSFHKLLAVARRCGFTDSFSDSSSSPVMVSFGPKKHAEPLVSLPVILKWAGAGAERFCAPWKQTGEHDVLLSINFIGSF